MTIYTTSFSKIELVDGEFYLKLNNGTKINIFLYKYKHVDEYTLLDSVFNTSFDYDLIVLDNDNNAYMYFTYNYIEEPEEVF